MKAENDAQNWCVRLVRDICRMRKKRKTKKSLALGTITYATYLAHSEQKIFEPDWPLCYEESTEPLSMRRYLFGSEINSTAVKQTTCSRIERRAKRFDLTEKWRYMYGTTLLSSSRNLRDEREKACQWRVRVTLLSFAFIFGQSAARCTALRWAANTCALSSLAELSNLHLITFGWDRDYTLFYCCWLRS